MRRTTTVAISTLAIGGALTFGTAYANQAATSTATPSPVVNENGHEVSPHAAKGQARAAEVHARNLARHLAKKAPTTSTSTATSTSTSTPTDVVAPATHAPNAHAGTRPDTHAAPSGTDHGKDGLPHGSGHAYGHDPAHAGKAIGHDTGGRAAR